MYEYRAQILDAHDGDTVHADVDLGFDLRQRQTLRLVGINAPELATPAGPPARDHLLSLLGALPAPVIVRTVKDHREKYGRYLATLIRSGDGLDINASMVADGFAVVYLP